MTRHSSIGRVLSENCQRVNSLIRLTLTEMVKYHSTNSESFGELQKGTESLKKKSWKSCRTYNKERHGSDSIKCLNSGKRTSAKMTDLVCKSLLMQ